MSDAPAPATTLPPASATIGGYTYIAAADGYTVIREGREVAASSMPAAVLTNIQRARQWIANDNGGTLPAEA